MELAEKSRQRGNNDNANVGEEVDTPPEERTSITLDPLAPENTPDEVDKAAWRMIPLTLSPPPDP
jgi:hypothetical protein